MTDFTNAQKVTFEPSNKKWTSIAFADVLSKQFLWAKYHNELYMFLSIHYTKVNIGTIISLSQRYYPEVARTKGRNFFNEVLDALNYCSGLTLIPDNYVQSSIAFPNAPTNNNSSHTVTYYNINDARLATKTILLPNVYPDFCTSYIRYCYTDLLVSFRFEQQAPKFSAFLQQVTGGDTILQDRIMEFLGYYLTPDMNKKCFVVLHGAGNSGKSILGKLLASLYNPEAVTSISIDDFHSTTFPKKIMDYKLALCMELSAETIDNKVVRGIKAATGNDLLRAGTVSFYNQCKLLFASNYPLITKTRSQEFMDRAVVIPFRYSIPEEQQNPNLLNELLCEASAIIFHALLAYQRLKLNNYKFSGDYLLNDPSLFPDFDPYGNHLFQFLNRYCKIGNKKAFTFTEELYTRFQDSEFCNDELNTSNFGKKLNQILDNVYPGKTSLAHRYAGKVDHQKKTQRGFWGIELKSDEELCNEQMQL